MNINDNLFEYFFFREHSTLPMLNMSVYLSYPFWVSLSIWLVFLYLVMATEMKVMLWIIYFNNPNQTKVGETASLFSWNWYNPLQSTYFNIILTLCLGHGHSHAGSSHGHSHGSHGHSHSHEVWYFILFY